jgi:DnaJ-class molecular chaperone
MCSPCQHAPRCPVCEGHGKTGRSRLDVCYRCGGSGIQPILSPEVKRRRAA